MGKHSKDHDGGPVGSRQDRNHAKDGWQEGGRDESADAGHSGYSQAESDRRAAEYAKRHPDA